jgi:phosphatidate cytidylyltransferase
LHPRVLGVLAGMISALLLGTVIRLLAIRGAPPEVAAKRWASLRTWWIAALLFGASILLGRAGVVLFFLLASLLALHEFLRLARVPYREWLLVAWLDALALAHYGAIWSGSHALAVALLPVGGLLLIAARMVIHDRAEGYLLTICSLYWGMMLTVYCLSHAALLLTLPASSNPVAGGAGWLLYLLLLTELSDIAQALVGRKLGRRPTAPVLSPRKTWEGLIAGLVTTILLAVVLAPILTPLATASLRWGHGVVVMPYLPAGLVGLLIGIGGYFGDLNISGIKRDVGVKDSGTMLPGQGGILDRVDSLTFTAPLFYYFVRYAVVVPAA